MSRSICLVAIAGVLMLCFSTPVAFASPVHHDGGSHRGSGAQGARDSLRVRYDPPPVLSENKRLQEP